MLSQPAVVELERRYRHQIVVGLVRRVLDEKRSTVEGLGEGETPAQVARLVEARAEAELGSRPHRVINGTGTILHTGLGRAPLSDAALESLTRVSAYSDLELDLDTGTRGQRNTHVQPLLSLLLECEAAMVVVNNAAAVLLALAGLAHRREVIVSRGEAVEIGGGFRVPEILRQSRAKLVEVGTTNRTTLADYAAAIGPRTAAVLRVHTSNFRVVGFTESPRMEDLAGLTREREVLLLCDNGSGSLVDTAEFGLTHEPMPSEAIAAGADVVTFSTDKLLGGPQGGVIAGRRKYVERLQRHQLARALRPDKIAIAALQATLAGYATGREREIPVISMLAETSDALLERAQRAASRVLREGVRLKVEAGESAVGGGSLPGETLATWLLILSGTRSPVRVAAALRAGDPAVIGRVDRRGLLVDMRTVLPREEGELCDALVSAARPAESRGEG